MIDPPVLQALVLADHVYTDVNTNKNVIAGTFKRLWAKSFPAVFGRESYAYIALTEVRQDLGLELRYVDLRDNKVLMSTKIPVPHQDPLETIELIVVIPPFPMPHPGAYEFAIHLDEAMLGSSRIMVGEKEQ